MTDLVLGVLGSHKPLKKGLVPKEISLLLKNQGFSSEQRAIVIELRYITRSYESYPYSLKVIKYSPNNKSERIQQKTFKDFTKAEEIFDSYCQKYSNEYCLKFVDLSLFIEFESNKMIFYFDDIIYNEPTKDFIIKTNHQRQIRLNTTFLEKCHISYSYNNWEVKKRLDIVKIAESLEDIKTFAKMTPSKHGVHKVVFDYFKQNNLFL